VVVLVAAHVLLVRNHGVVPPFELHERRALASAGGGSSGGGGSGDGAAGAGDGRTGSGGGRAPTGTEVP
jgi:hypothetical protein